MSGHGNVYVLSSSFLAFPESHRRFYFSEYKCLALRRAYRGIKSTLKKPSNESRDVGKEVPEWYSPFPPILRAIDAHKWAAPDGQSAQGVLV